MTAEYAAERIADAIAVLEDARVGPSIDEDLRSGGWFFEVGIKGRTYEVMVTEFTAASG